MPVRSILFALLLIYFSLEKERMKKKKFKIVGGIIYDFVERIPPGNDFPITKLLITAQFK